ncbi:hypothetical protein NDU88_002813 [Pleurodeles waltl]|uniref:Uncharacterized protein n=1 Tax=Pleurodeles waltl TaxID=8319 RepID=A0AAV7RD09_PLEWA|nr:hypothetical protein NDU88_002813 [Pleurodeles waltl]
MGPRVIPRPSAPRRSVRRSRRAEARSAAQAASFTAPQHLPYYRAEASSPRGSSTPRSRLPPSEANPRGHLPVTMLDRGGGALADTS